MIIFNYLLIINRQIFREFYDCCTDRDNIR